MGKSKKNISRKKLVAVEIVLIALVLLVGIALKTFPGVNLLSVANDSTESVSQSGNEVINNTYDMEKLKGSKYTSSGFDSIQINDSVETVEEKIGTLEQLNIESEYEAYVFNDDDLGSSYVFYFTDNQLKEVSVFITQ
ncbi:hypothetical protein RZE82_03240 [Mollicutes bacterium LVI A0039]|nr:hypothetical protein RZE82_03240 [Mollicutes bacterium LVI A0039]